MVPPPDMFLHGFSWYLTAGKGNGPTAGPNSALFQFVLTAAWEGERSHPWKGISAVSVCPDRFMGRGTVPPLERV